MLYCVANASFPMEYISSGNLVSQDNFLHDRRNVDFFVFLLVCEGELHIEQNQQKFDVRENESFLLFPGQTHCGYKPSRGRLSYYWVHFNITDPQYTVYNQRTLLNSSKFPRQSPSSLLPSPQNYFFLPEHGKLSLEKRSILLFVQLLDISKRDNYEATWRCRYALNLLLLEFTSEFLSASHLNEKKLPTPIQDMIEWIRTHYDEPITVEALAEQYNYHPTYLTALMKKYTGYPLSSYISHIRISIAKNILCRRDHLSIAEIAGMCGFEDEKYFMRLFKKLEGMTPTQYRNAFSEKRMNKN